MKNLIEDIELLSLRLYAQSLGVFFVASLSKDELRSAILLKLQELLERNQEYINNEFTVLCNYAESINASWNVCEVNDNACVMQSIKERIIELHNEALMYEISYVEYINDIQSLYNEVKLREKSALKSLERMQYEVNERENSQNLDKLILR